jgi:NitT/TauT family transport system permease protein
MARRLLWALPAPIALLALWHVAVVQGWMTIIPVPFDVSLEIWDFAVGGLYDGAQSGTLLVHAWASTSRVLTGFGFAAVVAVPLGVLMGRSRMLSALLGPTVNLMRPVPVTAWVPLVLIVFGLGSRATVILVFIAAFYPILLSTIAGVTAVPVRLLEAGQMLGTSRVRMLSSVVLPASLPSILTGMRVALGFAWVVVVVGETTGVTTGLGAVITEAREISNTGLIIAGMVFIGLAGFASDKLVGLAFRLARRNRPLTATV